MQEIFHKSLVPKVAGYCAAIQACENGKHREEAIRLLQEMLHRLLMADVVSHRASVGISASEKG